MSLISTGIAVMLMGLPLCKNSLTKLTKYNRLLTYNNTLKRILSEEEIPFVLGE